MSDDANPSRLSASPSAGPTARLIAKPVALNTFRENVVILARHGTAFRAERLAGLRTVEVRAGGLSLLASPILCDDPALVNANEVGLPQPMFHRLGVPAGTLVEVSPARPPKSLDLVRAKVAGETLTEAQFRAVAHDLADHRWSDMEVAAFLVACASFMTSEETLSLTRAMVSVGSRLAWTRDPVVDKHCIGGIPGNRTSLIVVPIVAAHGLWIPKTSSRAITSPAGTADTMEVLARVDLDEAQMRNVVQTCGGCVVWGGRVNLSPADDVLVSVERPLSIDTPEQMVASILSKKIAAGSTHLVLDVPVGPTAKIRDRRSALRLRKLFEYVAGPLGLAIDVVLTDGTQPIGRGIGPVLEARDVLDVLANRPEASADLREKAIHLAGRVLEADPALVGGGGARRARELLASGAAARTMDAIIKAQGPSPISEGVGALVHEVCAQRAGAVAAIDCLQIASIARLAGAPTHAGAGLDLLRKVGDSVRGGDPLYRIHGSEPADFRFAIEAATEDCGMRIGS
jgi:thymidine phosphorylase